MNKFLIALVFTALSVHAHDAKVVKASKCYQAYKISNQYKHKSAAAQDDPSAFDFFEYPIMHFSTIKDPSIGEDILSVSRPILKKYPNLTSKEIQEYLQESFIKGLLCKRINGELTLANITKTAKVVKSLHKKILKIRKTREKLEERIAREQAKADESVNDDEGANDKSGIDQFFNNMFNKDVNQE